LLSQLQKCVCVPSASRGKGFGKWWSVKYQGWSVKYEVVSN
jgi:hypothetical protein